MKKILMLSLVCVLSLTGCGESKTETVMCSSESTTGNITTKTDYSIDYTGNEVKKVRITYDYDQFTDTDNDGKNDVDGVETGTDGTTEDTQPDDDGIIDGVIGSAIDTIINATTDVIADIAGIRDRHTTVQTTYGNMTGFSVQNTTDTDNHYKVTYVVDYDKISDDDLTTLNLSRNIDTLKDTYTSQGFTCK